MQRRLRSRLALGFAAVLACGSLASGQLGQPKVGQPVNGLTPDQISRFDLGAVQFSREITIAEGLGPGFNQTSCAQCHNAPVAGGSGITSVTRFGLVEKGQPFNPLDNFGGSLLQAEAISMACQEVVPASANVQTFRITTSSFGIGLIEAIPDSAIEANETAQAQPGSNVSGFVHWGPSLQDPMGPLRAGRFGWKAQLADVRDFSADATLNEMGLTNAILGEENMPNGDPALLAMCDTVADPEDVPDSFGFTFVDRVTDFQRFLAGPPQTPRSGMAGEAVFNNIGCADCHVSSYTTGSSPVAALANKEIQPYSDFLLHDMGILGDGIVQGDALETEMRTPPLWGVRWRDALLHDGRVAAGTFESRMLGSILEHSGEAQASKDAFNLLSATEQNQLYAFLNSLGRSEFDHDDNVFIDNDDFINFWSCFTGPGSFYTPDDECSIHDVDQDGDVDADDFAVFEQVYEGVLVDCNMNSTPDMVELVNGTVTDCNANAIPDDCDISSGFSTDTNGNQQPDECEVDFIRGDCNGDGTVDIADAVSGLGVLFTGEDTQCVDACDNNDDGSNDIADPIYLVNFLFDPMSPAPANPFPTCGMDSSNVDSIGCDASSCP